MILQDVLKNAQNAHKTQMLQNQALANVSFCACLPTQRKEDALVRARKYGNVTFSALEDRFNPQKLQSRQYCKARQNHALTNACLHTIRDMRASVGGASKKVWDVLYNLMLGLVSKCHKVGNI